MLSRVASSRTPRAKCKLQCTAPVISDTDHLCPTPSLCQSGTVPPLPQWRGCCYSEHSPVSVNHTLGVCHDGGGDGGADDVTSVGFSLQPHPPHSSNTSAGRRRGRWAIDGRLRGVSKGTWGGLHLNRNLNPAPCVM